MSDLLYQFARIIEKYFEDLGIRPNPGIQGTNHIDNPEDWKNNEIYTVSKKHFTQGSQQYTPLYLRTKFIMGKVTIGTCSFIKDF